MNREATGRERSLAVAMLLLLGACPWMLARHQLSLLTELLILGLFALSLDLIMGYTGMVSFGHAAYFGLGAYGSALLLIHFALPVPLALLGGALLAGVVALPIGYLSTRATGIYFAMLTLAFAQLLYTVAYKWRDLTGGSDGIAGVPKTSLWWDGPSLAPGEIIAPAVGNDPERGDYHNNYQDTEKFLSAGGRRGRQYVPLTDGTYFINRWFATVEAIPKTVVPIGYVGVVVSYYGQAGDDVSGITFRHGA